MPNLGRPRRLSVDFFTPERHISLMDTSSKKTGIMRRRAAPERTVVYRGIKIAPMSGRRSATAQAIRDALRTKSEQTRGEPAHA